MADEATQDTTATADNADAGTDAPQGGQDKTFTQAELEKTIGERLAREREKYAGFDELKAKAEQFDALKDSQKTDLERLTGERDTFKEQASTAQQQAAEAEARYLRVKVGSEKGLPVSLAERLQGSDETEMAADADRLLEAVKPTNRGSFDGGVRPPADPDVEPGLGRLTHAYSQNSK